MREIRYIGSSRLTFSSNVVLLLALRVLLAVSALVMNDTGKVLLAMGCSSSLSKINGGIHQNLESPWRRKKNVASWTIDGPEGKNAIVTHTLVE